MKIKKRLKTIKKLMVLTLPLMIFLSCRNQDSYPKLDDQEQLSPVFIYEEINGKQYISIEKSKCLSRTYRISKHFIGPIDKAIKLNIKECQKIIGNAPTEYGVLSTWRENFRTWLINQL